MASKEKKGLKQWLDAHSSGRQDENALEHLWDLTENYKDGYEPNVEAGWGAFRQRMENDSAQPAKTIKMAPSFKILRIAAAVLLLLVAGFAINNFLGNGIETESVVTGENSTETLSLSDGTIVTLNELGSLTFPEKFTGGERRIRLEGEAFFEVAHDPSAPFILETNLAEIKVLGTSFNIRAYPQGGAPFQVFVKTGKVEVRLKANSQTYQLTPGQLLTLPEHKKVAEVETRPNNNALGWKEGSLRFRETPLNVILDEISQQFGVAFKLQGSSKLDCPFTISIEKNNLGEAFKALEASCPLRFKQSSEELVVVSGKCCE